MPGPFHEVEVIKKMSSLEDDFCIGSISVRPESWTKNAEFVNPNMTPL